MEHPEIPQCVGPDYFYLALRANMAPRPNPPASPLDAPEITVRVAGIRFPGHQVVADAVAVGEQVVLRREPGNAYDTNAVAVHRGDGMRFAYLPSAMAFELSPRLDQAGASITAVVTAITPFKSKAGVKTVEITFTAPAPSPVGADVDLPLLGSGEGDGE